MLGLNTGQPSYGGNWFLRRPSLRFGGKGKHGKKFTVFYSVRLTIAGRRTLTKYGDRKVTDPSVSIAQKGQYPPKLTGVGGVKNQTTSGSDDDKEVLIMIQAY